MIMKSVCLVNGNLKKFWLLKKWNRQNRFLAMAKKVKATNMTISRKRNLSRTVAFLSSRPSFMRAPKARTAARRQRWTGIDSLIKEEMVAYIFIYINSKSMIRPFYICNREKKERVSLAATRIRKATKSREWEPDASKWAHTCGPPTGQVYSGRHRHENKFFSFSRLHIETLCLWGAAFLFFASTCFRFLRTTMSSRAACYNQLRLIVYSRF